MSKTTPTDFGVVMSMDEVVFSDLSYTFYEGMVTPTDEGTFESLPFLLSFALITIHLVIRRRKK